MKTRAIGAVIAIIAIWMSVVGISMAMSFDAVAEENREIAEQEWSFVVDTTYEHYEDISPISGSDYFIGDSGIEYDLIDETGRVVAGSFRELESIGGGFVRFVLEPNGAIIEDENGNHIRRVVGVLDKNGDKLPREKAEEVLEQYAASEVVVGDGQSGEGGSDDGQSGNGQSSGGRNGNEDCNDSGTYKVVRYGRILGIAKAGE